MLKKLNLLFFFFAFFLYMQSLFATYETELPNYQTINNVADLPVAVGGTITLEDNTYYKFGGDGSPITLTDNLVIGSGSIIYNATISTSGSITFAAGGAIDYGRLTYTGTGNQIVSSNTTAGAVARVLDTRLTATNGTYFSASSTQPGFFILDTVALIGSGNTIGTFSGYSISIRGVTAQFAGQLLAGATLSNNSLVTLDSIEIPNGFSAPTIAFNFTGISQGSIQIEKVNINNTGTGIYAYKFDTGTTFNSLVNVHAGLVTDQIKEFAASSYDYSDVGFIFRGVGNISDSTVSANAYLTGNATNTVIQAQSAWHLVTSGVNWTNEYAERVSIATDGTTTYLGNETVRLIYDGNITFEPTLATKDLSARFGGIAPDQTVVTFTNATNLVNETATPRVNGDIIIFKNSGGTMPTGLYKNIAYYVVNQAINSFQLAYTPGGAVITFTDDGVGTLEYQVMTFCGSAPQNTIAAGAPREVIPQAIGEMATNCEAVVLISNLTDAVDILVSKAYYRIKK